MRIALAVALGLIVCLGTAWGEEVAYAPADLPAPGRLAPDPVSPTGQALVAPVEGLDGWLLPGGVPARPLPRGRLRADFRLRVAGDVDHCGTALLLQVFRKQGSATEQIAETALHALDFPSAGQYADFGVTFENRGEGTYDFRVGWRREHANQVDWKTTKFVPDLTEIALAGLTVKAETSLPYLAEVRSRQVLYRPGDEAAFSATIVNPTEAPQALSLLPAIVWDLDDQEPLPEIALTLQPGEVKPVPIPYRFGPREYGAELRCALRTSRGVLDAASSPFGVAQNGYQLCISAGMWNNLANLYSGDPAAIEKSTDLNARAFINRGCYFEALPDTFTDLAPTGDEWPCALGWPIKRASLDAAISSAHKYGMRIHLYCSNQFTMGAPAAPFAQAHPEFFLYNARTGEPTVGYYEDVLEKPDFYNVAAPFSWLLNTADPRVNDHHAEQVIATARMFHWDGVRFDGHQSVPDFSNFNGQPVRDLFGRQWADAATSDPLSVQMIRRFRQKVWAELPDFDFGYNAGLSYDSYYRQRPLEYQALCENGGMAENEVIRGAWDRSAPAHQWTGFLQQVLDEAVRARGYGGFHSPYGLDLYYPVDNLYQWIFTLAAGSHPVGAFGVPELPAGNYAKFATRYSRFLFGRDLRLLPEPRRRLRVRAEGPIWWQEWPTVRQEGEIRQYVVHLVNPPVQPNIFEDPSSATPRPLQNVRVALRLPPGEIVEKAWLLSPEPDTGGTALEPVLERGSAAVIVPQVQFWKVVVLQTRTKGGDR